MIFDYVKVRKLLLLATYFNYCIKISIVSKASILTSNYATDYAYYKLNQSIHRVVKA
jgi:hypothetical protein